MLSLMRKNAGTWLIKILLGAIVIVFVFWGVGSYSSRRANRVALVNGEPISVKAYHKTYNQLIEQLKRRFGSSLTDEMIKNLQVKRQAINRLIDRKLLLDEARRLNIKVSEAELAETIKNLPVFQTGGHFDRRRYQLVLQRFRMSPEDFEVAQREDMVVSRLQDFVTGMVKVSDPEARWWFDWQNTKVRINYVLFDPRHYTDLKISDKEIQSFYDQHKEQYKTDPLRKVRYIRFDPAHFASSVKIDAQAIRDYYDAHPKEFEKPKTVEARHILFKVAPDASPGTVKAARDKALRVLKMIRDGKDFAAMAKKYSEGPSKSRGGYLGSFTRQSMVKPFADKAFAMKPGEVSEPVRTQFGWHLIKVEKVVPASKLSFDDAKDRIRKKLVAERAKTLAYDAADDTFEAADENEDLAKIAVGRQLEARTTDFFSAKGPIKGIKDWRKFVAAAFKMEPMEISDVQDFGDGYYLLQVIDKRPGKVPDLKDVRPRVRADVLKTKQDQRARKAAADFLAALKKGRSMSAESARVGLKVVTSDAFGRNGVIPGIGYETAIASAAFKLSSKKPYADRVLKGRKGYYVIALKARLAPDPKGFAKASEGIRTRLAAQKKSKVFRTLLSELKAKSEISIEKEYLE